MTIFDIAVRPACVAILALTVCVGSSTADAATPRTLDGIGTTLAPGNPRGAAVSPDGQHVYVAAEAVDGVVMALERDPGDGTVGLVGSSPTGSLHTESVVVSPDGAHVYLNAQPTWTFERDPGTGLLSWLGPGVNGNVVRGPSAFSADGNHFYVGGFNRLAAYSRDSGTGELTFIEYETVIGLTDMSGVSVSPDGAHVYVSASSGSAVGVFARDPVTGAVTFVEAEQDGVGGVDGLAGATDVEVSPDGAHVYASGGVDGAVVVFSRDPGTGALTYVETHRDGVNGVDGLDGASDLVVTPDGNHVYVAGLGDDAVAIFSRDPGTGALTFLETKEDGGIDEPTRLTVSPDGENIYVSATFSFVAFARNAVTGSLTALNALGTLTGSDGSGPVTPRLGIAPSPDGLHVYMTRGYRNGTIGTFSRNVGTGLLTLVETLVDEGIGSDDLDGATGVVVSPNGAHVYVAATLENAVTAFARDAGTGRLTFVEAERDGVGGVDGLSAATAVDVSPDGNQVYVASVDDDAIAVFERDPVTGALTFVEAELDGVGGVDGLDGAIDVAVSPDGGHVYAASSNDIAIATFTRDPGTGALAFVGAVPGGASLLSIALSADGTQFYANGAALRVFARNPVTGTLTPREIFEENVNEIRGLFAPAPIVASPDNTHLYAYWGAVFARIPLNDDIRFVHERYLPFSIGHDIAVSPDHRHVYRGLEALAVGFSGCEPVPLASCRTAARTLLRVVAASRRVTWRWAQGEETAVEDLGNPANGSPHYAVCVYDESQPTASVAFRALAPANTFSGFPPWKDILNGYAYRDTFRTPEGLLDMKLKARSAGRSLVTVKAVGANVAMPPLPLGLPVRVQVQSSTGECWEAVYTSATQNGATGFRAMTN
jgi:6-phosphogluconolactonase (cycloisomerase 2 family)